jgi:peptidoglycan/xylan/chitin deacetylase (PgdA/CDA1 family)
MELRFDRLATLYLVHPYLRVMGAGERSIPILMYHSIADQDESGVHAYYRTATSPGVFAAQLEYLQAEGYKSCSLEYAMNHLRNVASTAEKLVVITFDDGYADFRRSAFPALQQYGFTATVFLPTAFIGDHPVTFKGKDCLTWREVRELERDGILFGSHTVNHPQLRELPVHSIRDEVSKSKKTIEEKLGFAVDCFAYPYAFPQTDVEFKKVLSNSLREAGYQYGVCTVVGRANRLSESLFLERLPVNSYDDAALFRAKLEGAYDWIASFQRISKTVKARLGSSTGRAKPSITRDFPAVQ